MAHLGEAQSLIKNYGLKKQSHFSLVNFYSNLSIKTIEDFKTDDHDSNNQKESEPLFLLITGEGPIEASTRTASAISWIQQYFSSKSPEWLNFSVINVGIAGSLNTKLKVKSSFMVRSYYLAHQEVPFYQSFQTAAYHPPSLFQKHKSKNQLDFVDCVTSFERVLNQNKANLLHGIADLVDREGWGVAFASKEAHVPFFSLKIVSDIAGNPGACELIREQKEEYSELIFQNLKYYFLNDSTSLLKSLPKEKNEVNFPAGFHFTHSTKHQFLNLMEKIALKEDISCIDLIEKLVKHREVKNILAMEILPKEKTKKFIEFLEKKLSPVKKQIDHRLQELKNNFHQHQIKISFDPILEKDFAQISFEVKDDTDLKEKAKVLSDLSIKSFTRIMNGELEHPHHDLHDHIHKES